ncbi:hypothetical protein ABIE78_001547 [Sinorhizobium fredii]
MQKIAVELLAATLREKAAKAKASHLQVGDLLTTA